MIPPVLKNTIKKEVMVCITEQGRDSEDCIDEASVDWHLDDDDKDDLREQLINGG